MRFFLLALGFLAGCVFGPLSIAADGYDQKQHLPENQIPVFVRGEQVGIVVIQSGRFNCPEGAKRAVLIVRNGAIWLGCATRDGNKLKVKFEDGDELEAKANGFDT